MTEPITDLKRDFAKSVGYYDPLTLHGVKELDAEQTTELLAYVEGLYGSINWWTERQRLRFLTVIRQLQGRLLELSR